MLVFAALVAIFAVSGALFRPGWVIGDGVDLYGTFWFYWWIDRCLTTWTDPSFTDMMFYPLGKDIFAHTGNNFVDAILAWPLQAVLPYPDYQPVWVAVLLFGNTWAFWPLAQHLFGPRSRAAAFSTALWALHPFALFECMTGRLTQALLWWVPLALLGFLRAGEDKGWLKWAVLAGVMTGLSGWTYWFLGYFVALAFGWLALVAMVRPNAGQSRLKLLRGWAVAAVVCGIVVAPGIVAMASAKASGAVPGLAEASAGWFDLPGGKANNVSSTLHGLVLMERHGQPQLTTLTWSVVAVLALVWGRRRARWVGLAALVAAFSVGPVWPTEGGEPIRMFHYLFAYHAVPFLDRLWFPYRMVVVCFLALSIAAGTVFSRVEERLGTTRAAVLGGAFVVLAAVEQARNLALPLVARDLTPPPVMAALGEVGGGLVELPIGLARLSIAWQPVHEQPTFGGMAENARLFWPDGFDRRFTNRFVQFLKGATFNPEKARPFEPTDAIQLRAEGFRWVVLDRHLIDANLHNTPVFRKWSEAERDRAPFFVQDRLTEALGAPVAVDGAVVVWDLAAMTIDGPQDAPSEAVLEAFAPTEASLSTRTWPLDDMPAYERKMRERGRLPGGPPPR